MTNVHSEPQVYLGLTAIIASPPMQRVMELVRRYAMTNATVLITGESGSGKELVARAIHHHSLRCSKPWVDVSCAALPEHLIESELFGHDKGAFSGADAPKPGLFELAHQGTLFLDEIGELEPRMQVKLLRVLDGIPYYRLGGTRKVSVDVRILAATNQNLDEAVKTGKFRSDLFHRLSQLHLRVPPLRERVDDVLPLAQHFLREQNPELSFAADAMRVLSRYGWPGNVRELRNTVLKAAVLAAEPQIRASELPMELSLTPLAEAVGPATNLDGVERRMILKVLAETGGHHQKAADLLGISRRTLTRKLKMYGMDAPLEQAAAQ